MSGDGGADPPAQVQPITRETGPDPASQSSRVDHDAATGSLPQEHHLQTLRTGRYFTQGAALKDARNVWIVLHGYAQLAARQLRHFNGIVPADTLIVVPEALSRFYLELPRPDRGHMARVGAAWLTREDRDAEIADANGWLDRVYRETVDGVVRASGVNPHVTVLAFSQGVATAMRWIAHGGVRVSRAIMWAGSTATDIDVRALQLAMSDTELITISGTRDQFLVNGNRELLQSAWASLGIPLRDVSYEGGHELNSAVLASLLNVGHPETMIETTGG